MKIESLDLYALKYFLDAVENQSLTRSAEINHVTRSAISQALVRLESWSGQRLITHEKKIFKLTTAGENFYRKMSQAYAGLKNSLESSGTIQNSIKIGCSASLSEYILIPQLKKMKSIDGLQIVTGTTGKLDHLLDEGELHISISIKDGHTFLKDELPISAGEFYLASRTGQMTDKLITTESRPEVLALKKSLVRLKAAPSMIQVESWSLAAQLALELKMSCLIPDFLAKASDLKQVPLKGFKEKYQVSLRHRPRWELSPAELACIDSLKA